MDEVKTTFLQTQSLKSLVWLRYTDNIFFIWNHGEEGLQRLLKDFNNFKSNHKYTLECDRYSIDFLDLNVKLNDSDLI